jgi:hypothetical protein
VHAGRPTVSLVQIPGGWWAFEGDEPPGMVFTSPDEGGDPDTVRQLLRLVDDDCAERGDEE